MRFIFVSTLVAFSLLFTTRTTSEAGAITDGKELYKKHCAPCHGEKGEGNGPVSKALFPKPIDLALGSYKIRSTPTGSLPTDEDIIRTIKNGMPGTSMIPWDLLDDSQIKALVPVVKGFSILFKDEKPDPPVKIPPKIKPTANTIAMGKKVYMEMKCWECHGEEGKGDGPKADKLKDDWGNPSAAFDFTKGDNLRGGNKPEDIYLRFITGINGTPMPSFEDSIKGNKRWYLVHYVQSLMKPSKSK